MRLIAIGRASCLLRKVYALCTQRRNDNSDTADSMPDEERDHPNSIHCENGERTLYVQWGGLKDGDNILRKGLGPPSTLPASG